jgi:zinc protease
MSTPTSESIELPNGLKAEHFTYPNGLRVLIVEMHTAPICGYMRVVNAGSSNEDGICGKGIAHFIEHMSFRIDGGKYWEFEKRGHEDNAMTTEDATSFYDFGDAKAISDLIEIDGHRFLTSAVPSEGIGIEMMAVLNEKERDTEAVGQLFTMAQMCSHLSSKYHISTIGRRSDIVNTTAEDMKKFREAYYQINNATFIVVGDVHTPHVLKHFERVYGDIKPPPLAKKPAPKEPVQLGKRSIELSMPSPCAMMCLTWVSPPANTKESICMAILSRIISNGNAGRKTNVLRQGVMHNVGSYAPRQVDSYMWCLHGSVGNPSKLKQGEKQLIQMVSGLQRIEYPELEAARASLRQEWTVSPYNNIHTTTMALGEAAALGNWKDIVERVATLETIIIQDLTSCASKYLKENKLTVVSIVPRSQPIREVATTPLKSVSTKAVKMRSKAEKCKWNVHTFETEHNGFHVQTLKTTGSSIYVNITIPYPHEERFNASLFDSMFLQQCEFKNKTYTAGLINNELDSLGIDVSCNKGHDNYNLQFAFNNAENVVEGMNFVVNGLLRNTTFSPEGFMISKRSIMSELAALKQNNEYKVKEDLVNKMFIHTSYEETLQYKESKMGKVGQGHLTSFYENHIQAAGVVHCTLACPSDHLDKAEKIAKMLRTAFKSAYNNTAAPEAGRTWLRKPTVDTKFNPMLMRGSGTSMVMMGQATNLKQYDEKRDGIALSLAVQSLGGGMTSDLMWTLRELHGKQNGTYGVYASQEDQQHATSFVVVQATFTPSLAQNGINDLVKTVKKWCKLGLDAEKLKDAKAELLGQRTLEQDDWQAVTSVFHRHLTNGKNGLEEWNGWKNAVENTTLTHVNEVIKKYMHPNSWVMSCSTPVKLTDSFVDSDDEN